jgi:hypothetical protein
MAEAFRIETIHNAVISSEHASAIRLSDEIRTLIVDKGEVSGRFYSMFCF